MKSLFKIFGILLAIGIFILALPLFVIVGAGATFYYWKKKPDKEKMIISAVATIIALVGSFTLLPAMLNNKNNTAQTPVVEIPKVENTPKVEEKPEEDNLEAAKNDDDKLPETPEIKNDGPEYTEESNQQFVSHFQEKLNTILAESGIQIEAMPVGHNVIYVYVPQEIKYESKASIQQVADSIYQAKDSIFTDWAIDNGYDLYFTKSPSLYVKTQDDTTLAEEKFLGEGMKVKIKN